MKNYEGLLKERYDFIFNNGNLSKLEQYCFVIKEEKFLRNLMETKDKEGKEKEAEDFNKKFKEFKEQYMDDNPEKFFKILAMNPNATKEIYDLLNKSINNIAIKETILHKSIFGFYHDIQYDELENIYKFFRDVKKFGFADIDIRDPELNIPTTYIRRIKGEHEIAYKNAQEEFKRENGYCNIFEERKEQVEKSRIKINREQCSNIDSSNILNFHKYIEYEYEGLKNV